LILEKNKKVEKVIKFAERMRKFQQEKVEAALRKA